MEAQEEAPYFPRPTCEEEVRKFLGLVAFCRPFINNFEANVAPLTILLHPHAPFFWTQAQENAFCELQSQLLDIFMTDP